jgi:hypothetical protein
MIEQQIIAELRQIPEHKLPEIFDLIHYYRLGLTHEQQTNSSRERRPGSLLRLAESQNISIAIPADFNEPLSDFQEYQ